MFSTVLCAITFTFCRTRMWIMFWIYNRDEFVVVHSTESLLWRLYDEAQISDRSFSIVELSRSLYVWLRRKSWLLNHISRGATRFFFVHRNKLMAHFCWYKLRVHLLFSVSQSYITFSRIQINQYIPIQSVAIFFMNQRPYIHFIHYVGSNISRVLMYKFTFAVYIPRGVIILTFRCCQRSNTYKCLAFFLLFLHLGMRETNVTNFYMAEICVVRKKRFTVNEFTVFIRL